MRQITFWITIVLLICVTTSCHKSEQQVQFTNVQPKSEPFQINGLSVPSDPTKYNDYINSLRAKLNQLPQTKFAQRAAGTGGPVSYFDWIMYSYISCQAAWNEFCSGTIPLNAPPGWQVCKFLSGPQQSNGNAYFSITPANWYNGDTENPPRFNAYSFYIYAHGSGSVFNQTGANIYVPNVGLRLIASSANNYDRYATGCDLPKP